MVAKVYSGTPLNRPPLGPVKVSLVEGWPHFWGEFILKSMLWDFLKWPEYRSGHISGGVPLYTKSHTFCKHLQYFGKKCSTYILYLIALYSPSIWSRGIFKCHSINIWGLKCVLPCLADLKTRIVRVPLQKERMGRWLA